MSRVRRQTKETTIEVRLARQGGEIRIDTGVPFLDHMMTTFGRYAGIGLVITATGDLPHHLIEDVALTVGRALRAEIPDNAARFGHRTVPMDDALVEAALDLGGRPYYQGPLPSRLYDHWMRSFTDSGLVTLHLRVIRGRDRHHIVEAGFKALGLAVRDALASGGEAGIFSTKGAVALESEP